MRLLHYIRIDARDPNGDEQRKVIASFKPDGDWDTSEHVEKVKRAVGDYPALKSLIRSIRAGADLVVVADFWRLASRLVDLDTNFAAIRDKKNPATKKKLGIVVVEARTGFRSDCQAQLVNMVRRSANYYSGRMLAPEKASEYGKQGAEASPVTKPKVGRAPWKVIAEALRSQGTVDDAVAYINSLGHETPINRIWLYREALRRKTTIKALRSKRSRPST